MKCNQCKHYVKKLKDCDFIYVFVLYSISECISKTQMLQLCFNVSLARNFIRIRHSIKQNALERTYST